MLESLNSASRKLVRGMLCLEEIDGFFLVAFVAFSAFLRFLCILFGGNKKFSIFACGKGCCNNLFPRLYKYEQTKKYVTH